ncbi:hypothetical protein [Streptomyces sp. Tu 2975]|uniref:hypothetical protein n=1 Tax=Streptomyces sp. Tu 2975 TaxID=2676871 RepID=UPI001ABDF774|nr:hypothetical protein [Streptomyces sp. Tu 2975]
MGFTGSVPGAARLDLVDGVALLRPEQQVFTAMLTGSADQQLARNLARTTVEGRENTVKAADTPREISQGHQQAGFLEDRRQSIRPCERAPSASSGVRCAQPFGRTAACSQALS